MRHRHPTLEGRDLGDNGLAALAYRRRTWIGTVSTRDNKDTIK